MKNGVHESCEHQWVVDNPNGMNRNLYNPIRSISQIVNVKQKIIIIYGYFVQSIIVNTHFQLIVLFNNK
jgi:hypothetical protein